MIPRLGLVNYSTLPKARVRQFGPGAFLARDIDRIGLV